MGDLDRSRVVRAATTSGAAVGADASAIAPASSAPSNQALLEELQSCEDVPEVIPEFMSEAPHVDNPVTQSQPGCVDWYTGRAPSNDTLMYGGAGFSCESGYEAGFGMLRTRGDMDLDMLNLGVQAQSGLTASGGVIALETKTGSGVDVQGDFLTFEGGYSEHEGLKVGGEGTLIEVAGTVGASNPETHGDVRARAGLTVGAGLGAGIIARPATETAAAEHGFYIDAGVGSLRMSRTDADRDGYLEHSLGVDLGFLTGDLSVEAGPPVPGLAEQVMSPSNPGLRRRGEF